MFKLNKNSRNMCCTLAVIVVLVFLLGAVRSEKYKKMKCVRLPQREYGAKMCAYKKNWVELTASTIPIPDDIVSETVDIPASDEGFNKLFRTCRKDPNCVGLHIDDKNGKVMFLSAMPQAVYERTIYKANPGMTSKDLIKQFKVKERSKKAEKAAMKLEKAMMESSDN